MDNPICLVNKSNSIKIIMIGDSGVGKTCICNRIINNKYDKHTPSTIGAHFFTKVVPYKDENIILNFWDTAGQERFRSLINLYFRGSDVVLLVFDLTEPDSLNNIDEWYSKINENNIEKPYILFFLKERDLLLTIYLHIK